MRKPFHHCAPRSASCPGNPEVHHSLGTALERSGHKDEAEKEFAIHERLRSEAGTQKPE